MMVSESSASQTMTLLFLLTSALIFYILVGYPLLLRIRPSGPAIAKKPQTPSVTAIVAVKNGDPWIAAKMDSLLGLDYPPELLTILVVSDGSTDQTDSIVESYAARHANLKFLRVTAGGKCAAISAAVPLTSSELLLMTDVRQILAPNSLRELVANLADPTVGAVSGEMRIRNPDTLEESSVSLYWRFETWIRHSLSRIDSMLGVTGPFYVIRRSLFIPVPPHILLDDMYLPLHAFFLGYRLVSDPLAVAWDYPTSLETEFRRKVRTLAGNYQLLRYYPQLLSPFQNRLWLDYLSYKIGRLLLPHLLLLVFAFSFALPSPWPLLVLTPQFAVYGLALLGNLLPKQSPLRRICAPAQTFVTMMAAAFCAQAIFFTPPQKLWQPTRTRGPA
jgi:cellulose synthase/poly-beta-1,6-N-acetylglucosamine synthase-like glycosyltransferase